MSDIDPVVLVTTRSFSSGALDLDGELAVAGLRVLRGPGDHDLDLIADELPRVVAWIAGSAPVTAAMLDRLPALRIVARYGVGVDAVDVGAAADRGILVSNTPGANSSAVADHTLALLLAALRRVPQGDRGVRSDDWRVQRAREVSGLTVGIAGFGRIGRGVAERLSGFGCEVRVADPFLDDTVLTAAGVIPSTFAELAARCDVVSLHAPGERPLVDAEWLATAREGLVLVNTARAVLVDDAALADALRSGRVAAYASDTPPAEPGLPPESPLLDADLADCTVFTPHSAAQTVQAVDGMGRGAVDAVLAVRRGGTPFTLVDPPRADTHQRGATR